MKTTIRIAAAAACFAIASASGQTAEQWAEWGARLHGGYGSMIALGVRIGLDAERRLGAPRRSLSVRYVEGADSPCPCIVDGIAIAISASPGQRSLVVEPERAGKDLLARIRIVHKASGRALEYDVPASAMPDLDRINRERKGADRHAAVMEIAEARLFEVREVQK